MIGQWSRKREKPKVRVYNWSCSMDDGSKFQNIEDVVE